MCVVWRERKKGAQRRSVGSIAFYFFIDQQLQLQFVCLFYFWLTRRIRGVCVCVRNLNIFDIVHVFFLFYFNHLFKKNNSLGTVDNVMIPFYYISYSACFVSLLIIFNLYFICCINADKILYVLCFAVGHRDFGHFFL